MFDLHPPGSFPLCADPALQDAAAADLSAVSEAVRNTMKPFSVLGLLLVGSVSRGEGTLVPDPETGSRWLGDLECQLVYHDQRGVPVDQISHLLHGIETSINEAPDNRRRGMRVGLSAIADSNLARLRPAIFTREFLEHGKLLWGDPGSVPQPPWWLDGQRDVPLIDAFRLLNNRIVQQLEARMNRETGASAPLAAEYALNKFWIELATSLSLFLGCYRSSYRGRQAALHEHLANGGGPLDPDHARLLLARLDEAMDVKMGRRPSLVSSDERFAEAANLASLIWYWESDQLLGGSGGPADWNSIVPRLKRINSSRQRIRDWGRFFLRPGALRYLRPGMKGIVTIALRAGSFANAIYGSASLLDFFWSDLAVGNDRGFQVERAIADLFNLRIGGAIGSADRFTLAEITIGAWNKHLRFAPA